MADASADRDVALSWTERFYQTVPVSPVWVGVGIAGGLLLFARTRSVSRAR